MKLPKKINFGSCHYTIGWMDRVYAEAHNQKGECDRFKNEITIHPDLPDDMMKETLLHEIMHANFYLGAVDGGDEEKIVSILSERLRVVFRLNPKLKDILFD